MDPVIVLIWAFVVFLSLMFLGFLIFLGYLLFRFLKRSFSQSDDEFFSRF